MARSQRSTQQALAHPTQLLSVLLALALLLSPLASAQAEEDPELTSRDQLYIQERNGVARLTQEWTRIATPDPSQPWCMGVYLDAPAWTTYDIQLKLELSSKFKTIAGAIGQSPKPPQQCWQDHIKWKAVVSNYNTPPPLAGIVGFKSPSLAFKDEWYGSVLAKPGTPNLLMQNITETNTTDNPNTLNNLVTCMVKAQATSFLPQLVGTQDFWSATTQCLETSPIPPSPPRPPAAPRVEATKLEKVDNNIRRALGLSILPRDLVAVSGSDPYADEASWERREYRRNSAESYVLDFDRCLAGEPSLDSPPNKVLNYGQPLPAPGSSDPSYQTRYDSCYASQVLVYIYYDGNCTDPANFANGVPDLAPDLLVSVNYDRYTKCAGAGVVKMGKAIEWVYVATGIPIALFLLFLSFPTVWRIVSRPFINCYICCLPSSRLATKVKHRTRMLTDTPLQWKWVKKVQKKEGVAKVLASRKDLVYASVTMYSANGRKRSLQVFLTALCTVAVAAMVWRPEIKDPLDRNPATISIQLSSGGGHFGMLARYFKIIGISLFLGCLAYLASLANINKPGNMYWSVQKNISIIGLVYLCGMMSLQLVNIAIFLKDMYDRGAYIWVIVVQVFNIIAAIVTFCISMYSARSMLPSRQKPGSATAEEEAADTAKPVNVHNPVAGVVTMVNNPAVHSYPTTQPPATGPPQGFYSYNPGVQASGSPAGMPPTGNTGYPGSQVVPVHTQQRNIGMSPLSSQQQLYGPAGMQMPNMHRHMNTGMMHTAPPPPPYAPPPPSSAPPPPPPPQDQTLLEEGSKSDRAEFDVMAEDIKLPGRWKRFKNRCGRAKRKFIDSILEEETFKYPSWLLSAVVVASYMLIFHFLKALAKAERWGNCIIYPASCPDATLRRYVMVFSDQQLDAVAASLAEVKAQLLGLVYTPGIGNAVQALATQVGSAVGVDFKKIGFKIDAIVAGLTKVGYAGDNWRQPFGENLKAVSALGFTCGLILGFTTLIGAMSAFKAIIKQYRTFKAIRSIRALATHRARQLEVQVDVERIATIARQMSIIREVEAVHSTTVSPRSPTDVSAHGCSPSVAGAGATAHLHLTPKGAAGASMGTRSMAHASMQGLSRRVSVAAASARAADKAEGAGGIAETRKAMADAANDLDVAQLIQRFNDVSRSAAAAMEVQIGAVVYFIGTLLSCAVVQLYSVGVLLSVAWAFLLHPLFWSKIFPVILPYIIVFVVVLFLNNLVVNKYIGNYYVSNGDKIHRPAGWFAFMTIGSIYNLVNGLIIAVLRFVLLFLTTVYTIGMMERSILLIFGGLDKAHNSFLAGVHLQESINQIDPRAFIVGRKGRNIKRWLVAKEIIITLGPKRVMDLMNEMEEHGKRKQELEELEAKVKSSRFGGGQPLEQRDSTVQLVLPPPSQMQHHGRMP